MNDLDISHHFASPDCVFRPHRCQPCFLRGCNSSNRWVGWGFKSIRSTCIRSSFQYSHCGVLSWTMDRLFLLQEPHQILICRTNFLLDQFVVAAVWQSIAYLLEYGGLLQLQQVFPWYTVHTPTARILVSWSMRMLNEYFVTNSSPSNGSITMDRAEAHCGIIPGSTQAPRSLPGGSRRNELPLHIVSCRLIWMRFEQASCMSS